MIYKNYYTHSKQPMPFCLGEDNDFFDSKEEAIEEIIEYDCEGTYIYHHTLAISSFGKVEEIDLQDEVMKQHQQEEQEAIAEREHESGYHPCYRN